MFDTGYPIATGVLTGLFFGFVLQKAQVTRYRTILGQFLFTDFTVLKVMLTAIVTGGIGILTMHQLGWVSLHVKSAVLAANAAGGLIFGVGMALAGYCPGTGAAALGDGSRHALFAVLGMVVGAGLYAETFPYLQENLLKWGSYGKVTLADLLGLSPWLVLLGLAAAAGFVFALVRRWEHRKSQAAHTGTERARPLPAH
ncbi:MAG: YeeE/YedE family protein [Planctomycetota bacterium]|nr:YeeE/YedE family protein [Planctomycetota bacterium]